MLGEIGHRLGRKALADVAQGQETEVSKKSIGLAASDRGSRGGLVKWFGR